MKKIIIWMLSILLIASCNSTRMYDTKTCIIGFYDGTYIECVGYSVEIGLGDEYIVKNINGNQFFDKSKVKFIYIKTDNGNKN